VAKPAAFGSSPAEAAVVALVVSWRANGLTVRQIAALLRHAEGVFLSTSEVRSILARSRAARARKPDLNQALTESD
jgi:hypothetical protein